MKNITYNVDQNSLITAKNVIIWPYWTKCICFLRLPSYPEWQEPKTQMLVKSWPSTFTFYSHEWWLFCIINVFNLAIIIQLKFLCELFFILFYFFQEYIAQRSSDFRKTFVKFDSDGDGKVSRKEFRMVWKQICELLLFPIVISVKNASTGFVVKSVLTQIRLSLWICILSQ